MKFRKRFRYNKKRVFIYLFFIMLLSTLTLGYSLLSTTLQIEGVGKISKAVWNIHFDNIQPTTGSITPTQEPTISNDTNITFNLKLSEPGEFYEFTADIVNEGTIDAKINSFSILPVLTEAQKKYFNYTVTYSDGTEIKTNDALNAGTTEKIKVRFEYLTQEDTSLYPTEDQEFTFDVDIDYVQGKGEEVIHGLTGTRYTTNMYQEDSEGNWIENSSVWIGRKPTDNITLYNTVAEAKSAFSNRPFYLKHELENDIVKDSYVCFEKDSNTYCLRGFQTYDNNAGEYIPEYYDSEKGYGISLYYESNKTILKNAFGESNCTQYSSYLNCSVRGLSARAYEYGNVDADDGSANCDVGYYGHSYCYEW